ncbi:MAG: hypothetical protein ABI780_01820 [Ardenticatenales bacterium]
MSAGGWIGVDLDGTLAEYGGWNIGAPVPAMLERVRSWLAEGTSVKCFTARAGLVEMAVPVRAWLDALGLQDVGITNVKDFGMVELWDDRAVRVVMNTGERCCEPTP